MISIDMLLSPNYKYPSFCYIGNIELSTHLKLNIREQTLCVLKTKLLSLPRANGIGRQVVLSLLKRGASVAAVDRDDKGLNALLEVTKEYGAAIDVFVTDITRVDDVKRTISAIIERFVHIDGMINVAGIIQPFVDVVDLEITHINRVMDVNFYGTVYMVKALLPH